MSSTLWRLLPGRPCPDPGPVLAAPEEQSDSGRGESSARQGDPPDTLQIPGVRGLRALWGHEAGPPLLAPVGSGDAVPRLRAAGRGLAVEWRAEQACLALPPQL